MKLSKNIFFIMVVCSIVTSCMTRAPSDYQLDMKAGLISPKKEKDEQKLKENLSALKVERNSVSSDAKEPVYTSPLIEEVYIYPQKLSDDSFLSGIKMWIVVDKGDWYASIHK